MPRTTKSVGSPGESASLVGLGVRLLAGQDEGVAPGVTAAVIAVLAILAGKFAAVSQVVSKVTTSLPPVKAKDMIVDVADDICRQREAKRIPIDWPPGMSLEKASNREDYPKDVWQEASQTWDKLGLAEQERRIEERKKFLAGLKGNLRGWAFKDSFSGFDILWFILATATAFKLGSGLVKGLVCDLWLLFVGLGAAGGSAR